MPSSTERQRRFMGAELARKRAGQRTKTGMSEEKLEHFASKPRKKRPKASVQAEALKRGPKL